MCELARHGTAGARHGMCELVFKVAFDIPLGKQTSAHFLPYTLLATARFVVTMFAGGQTDTAQYCPQIYTVQPFTITPILTSWGCLALSRNGYQSHMQCPARWVCTFKQCTLSQRVRRSLFATCTVHAQMSLHLLPQGKIESTPFRAPNLMKLQITQQ